MMEMRMEGVGDYQNENRGKRGTVTKHENREREL